MKSMLNWLLSIGLAAVVIGTPVAMVADYLATGRAEYQLGAKVFKELLVE